jgi:hypothetical protein
VLRTGNQPLVRISPGLLDAPAERAYAASCTHVYMHKIAQIAQIVHVHAQLAEKHTKFCHIPICMMGRRSQLHRSSAPVTSSQLFLRRSKAAHEHAIFIFEVKLCDVSVAFPHKHAMSDFQKLLTLPINLAVHIPICLQVVH